MSPEANDQSAPLFIGSFDPGVLPRYLERKTENNKGKKVSGCVVKNGVGAPLGGDEKCRGGSRPL